MNKRWVARGSHGPGRDGTVDCFLALLVSLVLSLIETMALTQAGQDPAASAGDNEMVALMMLLTVFPLLLFGQAVLFGAWLLLIRR